MPQIWETLHTDWFRQEFRILAANFRHYYSPLIKKLSLVFMKTQISFKYQEWKALSKFVGLAERDLHTPLNSQAYLCSLLSRSRLQINPPIVPRQLIHLQRNPALTPFPLEKQVLQNTWIHIRRNAWKPPVLHRHMHSTHKPGKKDIKIKAQQQKGHSTHTDEDTQQRLVEHKSPLLPHLLFLPALFAKPWLAIKALQRNLLLLTLTQSGFPPLCKS